ncbi:DUF4198 domain-containing protein [Microvirga lenta]|uniref:DUF4198 domain-containing protein n=1 Tax=Microvirga lenta TaxID=2881337 RepID=UPI001CFFB4CD|nr:DUF4198 domain-containing protein [Microvirga lenta]MCB5175025.1 DUF4198 domain-containing protein [Microvirga lenta]
MLRRTYLIFSALAAMTTAAQAHGIWVAQRHGDLAVVYGHGAGDEAYLPAKVKEAVSRLKSGETKEARIVRQARNALVEPAPEATLLTVVFDNGIWTKGPDGKSVNKLKAEVPGAQSASHSIKTNTTVLASGGSLKPAGLGLEIVPLVDPVGLEMGDDLPVQVLADGQPVAGVALNTDYLNDPHAMSAKTDAEGKVTLFVRNDGLNVIGVAHVVQTPDNPDTDRVSYFATLSFTLPHADD